MLTTTVARETMRLVVIDHQPLVRDRVVSRLRRESGIEVVAAGGSAEAAIASCEREFPDVLLLDPFLPDAFIPDLVTLLRMTSPETRIIIITDTPDHPAVTGALSAGATGLLMKDPADRAGHGNAAPMPAPNYCNKAVAAHLAVGSITPRERQVTRLVADGHTNVEIGSRLGLSNNTVKSYLRNVMQKLQARNRAQLVTNARRHGLL